MRAVLSLCHTVVFLDGNQRSIGFPARFVCPMWVQPVAQ